MSKIIELEKGLWKNGWKSCEPCATEHFDSCCIRSGPKSVQEDSEANKKASNDQIDYLHQQPYGIVIVYF
jgi:hypothetical protein